MSETRISCRTIKGQLSAGMKAWRIYRYSSGRIDFVVDFAEGRTMNAFWVGGRSLERGEVGLISNPRGIVDRTHRDPEKLGIMTGFIGDFDGGPKNAGWSEKYPLHGELSWAYPENLNIITNETGNLAIESEFIFYELAVNPEEAVQVKLVRRVGLLPEPELGYYIRDEWEAIRPSKIMILAHPNTYLCGSHIMTTAKRVQARDEDADKGLEEWNQYTAVGKPAREHCYFLSDFVSHEGWVHMFNYSMTLISGRDNWAPSNGFLVRYRYDDLPVQFQNGCIWKCPFDARLGLEFGSLPIGREKAQTAEDPHHQLYLLNPSDEGGKPLILERQVVFIHRSEVEAEIGLINSLVPDPPTLVTSTGLVL